MKLFTPGPVMHDLFTLKEGGTQHPYFRTSEFSEIMLRIKNTVIEFIDCHDGYIVPLGSSGTGAIDCVFTNLVKKDDLLLIINNGTFGERLIEMCSFYKFRFIEYKVPFGKKPDLNFIEKTVKDNNITIIMTQGTETSSSQRIPLKEIGDISKKYNSLFFVDAITAFLIDEYSMDNFNIDVSILSSQKSFTVPPGAAFLVFNQKIADRVELIPSMSYYFNIKSYIMNMERGQTPFSPPVTILHQIDLKLQDIKKIGLSKYISKINTIALNLREQMKQLPFKEIAENPSNCLTTYEYVGNNNSFDAVKLFEFLKNEYSIFITPVGGNLAKTNIRIAHIGNLTISDNDILVDAIKNFLQK